jgi:hypothetical protein
LRGVASAESVESVESCEAVKREDAYQNALSALISVNRVCGSILLAIALTSVLARLINYFPGWVKA